MHNAPPGNQQSAAGTRQPILQVYDLRRTCIAAPSQWEGRLNECGSIYIRYRWGRLTTRVSMTDGNAVATGTCVYDDALGDRLGAWMETSEMQKALVGICHFNGPCDEEYWQHGDS